MIGKIISLFTGKPQNQNTMQNSALLMALLILQEALVAFPQVAAALRDMFQKGDPTPEDWEKLRAMVGTPFEVLAPNAAEQIAEASLVVSEAQNGADPVPTGQNIPQPVETPAPAKPVELASFNTVCPSCAPGVLPS